MKKEPAKPKKEYKPSDFRLGESVKVLSMNLNGTIASLPDNRGNLTVQMGILRSQVNISDLEIIDEKPSYLQKTGRQTGKGKLKMNKSLSVGPEINLLGKTVDRLRKPCPSKFGTHCTRQGNRSLKKRHPSIPAKAKTCQILPARSLWRGRCRSNHRRIKITGT